MSVLAEQLKKVLKLILPRSKYESLARVKRRLRSTKEDQLSLVIEAIESGSFNDADLIKLKNLIQVVGRMDYQRADIYLHIDSMTEYDTRLHSCRKEPDTVAWIEESIKPGDVFFDVGANVGAYSLVAAKYLNGEVRIFAFEPAYLNFAQLCRNVFLNGCQDMVVPLSIALSNQTSIGEFNYHDLIVGGSLHTFGEAVDHKGQSFTPVFVQRMLSYRLDDLIDQFELPVPTHIKIDVDGIEKAVLEGAPRTLSNVLLRSVIVELEAGESEREIAELMINHGFKLESKYERWTPGMLNCIFSRAAH